MRIILDFDDTLFDRDGFMRDLARVMGVEYNQFLDSYSRNFKQQHKFYCPYQHLRILYSEAEIRGKMDAMEDFLQDLSDFVYPGGREFLQVASANTEELILLSWGDPDFQHIKIKNCKLQDFFDKIITTENKIEVLQDWGTEPFIFINDKQEENQEIEKRFPQGRVYLVGEDGYTLKQIMTLWEQEWKQ